MLRENLSVNIQEIGSGKFGILNHYYHMDRTDAWWVLWSQISRTNDTRGKEFPGSKILLSFQFNDVRIYEPRS